MPTVCKRVLYTGRVQGVGFRYTAQGLARGRPVAGYVRNLPDGRVELAAEGPAEVVDGFLAAVASRMGGYVTGAAVEELPPQGYSAFTIRH
jgi:acylphosphatase